LTALPNKERTNDDDASPENAVRAFSDVEYWVVAADLDTGTTRVYRNVPGSLQGVADVGAFPEDDSAVRPHAAPASSNVAARSGDLVRTDSRVDAVPCVSGPETLCLVDGRFEVEVAWSSSASKRSGSGVAVPRTDQSGVF
jgi:hypothetical protein